MGEMKDERALQALGAALDAQAPVVRHGRREFPEGTPFLWLSSPGSGKAAVFLEGGQWIYLGEPGRGRGATQLAAGRIDDDPALVAERIVAALLPARRRPTGLPRLLRASGVGLAAGVGMGLLGMVIMAVLVGGNGYLNDTTIAAVHLLAVVLGVVAGLWAGIRWWRLG